MYDTYINQFWAHRPRISSRSQRCSLGKRRRGSGARKTMSCFSRTLPPKIHQVSMAIYGKSMAHPVWCFFGGLESSFQAFRRFDKDGSGVASICSKHRKRHSMVVVVGFLEAAECRHMCAYLGPGRRRLDEFEMDRKSWCGFLLISCWTLKCLASMLLLQ